MIAAGNSWVIALDNLSGIKNWLSDSLCRLAAGGGFATRRLYTNDGEAVFEAKRPIVLNGIEEVITRPDLAERSLVVHLPTISASKRRIEAEVDLAFGEAHPRILGALLDVVAAGLKNEPDVRLKELPRMADFTKWVVAAESALPWDEGAFLRAYEDNRREVVEFAIEESPLAQAVRRAARLNPNWQGTPTDLLRILNGLVEDGDRGRGWPSAPSWLSRKLRCLAPFLRQSGIDIQIPRRSKERQIHIRRTDQNGVDAVDAVDADESTENKGSTNGAFDGIDGIDGKSRTAGGQPYSHPDVERIFAEVEARHDR